MEKQKCPELRYSQYKNDWYETTLGNLMTVGSVKRVHQADWCDKGVRFLRARDIVAFSKNEDIADPIYISTDKYDEYSKLSGSVQVGDLLVTGVGTIGIPMLIENNNPIYFKDGNIIWFKNENTIDGLFLYYSFKNNKIQNFIKDSAGIGTVGTYTITNGKKTPVYLPQENEQKFIGGFFQNLDQSIALHEKKLAQTQNLKKAMLEKMFPKTGSKQPAIRLKGFRGEWEHNRLGNITTFINGRAYRQAELLKQGKYPVLRVGNFNTNSYWYFSDLELDQKYYAESGDLLYTWSTAFSPYIWNGKKVIYHYHIWKIELSSELDKLFTLYFLKADEIQLTNNTNGSTMIHVTKGEMENKIIVYPSLDEQIQIGKFFKQLDETLVLQQQQLQTLKNLKKVFLEKMFV